MHPTHRLLILIGALSVVSSTTLGVALASGQPLAAPGVQSDSDTVNPRLSGVWSEANRPATSYRDVLEIYRILDQFDLWNDLERLIQRDEHQTELRLRHMSEETRTTRNKNDIGHANAQIRHVEELYGLLEEAHGDWQEAQRRSGTGRWIGHGLRFVGPILGIPEPVVAGVARGVEAAYVGGSPLQSMETALVAGLASWAATEAYNRVLDEGSAVIGLGDVTANGISFDRLGALVNPLTWSEATATFTRGAILSSGRYLEDRLMGTGADFSVEPAREFDPVTDAPPDSRRSGAFVSRHREQSVAVADASDVGLPEPDNARPVGHFENRSRESPWGYVGSRSQTQENLIIGRHSVNRFGWDQDVRSGVRELRGLTELTRRVLRQQGLNTKLEAQLAELIEIAERLTRMYERDRAAFERLVAEAAAGGSWGEGILRVLGTAVVSTVGGPLAGVAVSSAWEVLGNGGDMGDALVAGFQSAAFATAFAAAQDLGMELVDRWADWEIAADPAQEKPSKAETAAVGHRTRSHDNGEKRPTAVSGRDPALRESDESRPASGSSQEGADSRSEVDWVECTKEIAECGWELGKAAYSGESVVDKAGDLSGAFLDCLAETSRDCPEAVLSPIVADMLSCGSEMLDCGLGLAKARTPWKFAAEASDCLVGVEAVCPAKPALPSVVLDANSCIRNGLDFVNRHAAVRRCTDTWKGLVDVWEWVTTDRGRAPKPDSYWGVDVEELLRRIDERESSLRPTSSLPPSRLP